MDGPLFDGRERDFERLRRTFRWRVPARFNIADACCDRHRDRAREVAILHEDARGAHRAYTFGALRELSNRLANALAALGVGPGDRVAILLPQRPETAIAHLAVYKLGAVALPLSILFGPEALAYRLADSGARIAIADEARAARIEGLREALPQLEHVLVCGPGETGSLWERLRRGADRRPDHETAADDPAYLIYTSGTTGPPKGALCAHRALIGNLPGFELSHNFYGVHGGLFWTPADWAWTGGLMDALLPALCYGQPVLGYEGEGRFDPDRAFHLMARHGVRSAFIPPTAMKMLMQVPSPPRLALRTIMSAGEQVGAEILRWSAERLGVPVNEMWGQTEFNYLVGNCSEILPVRPGSMGRPYPGHEVDVVDEEGRPCPPGVEGEIAARREGDPVMFLGYWNNEEATRAKFLGPWFLTGDVGRRDEDGYLWFVGRKDDVITSAGYRIGPGEIEDCLIRHPAVAQAAVIGVPDPLRGEIVKAFIVLAPGHEPSEALTRDIQASVRERLAAYEYPREIEYIEALPMTTTGKVRRTELRARERARRGG
ncbi:acyl-CoA synthetase [Inmirania thermothiophila]|uniref:Acetyl-CoA synthetase n=1 Tax=Inmirania thermothiophila TaxID=1750597 RepID=A0A3N1Y1K7_9GAMM|nr:AMP-binding protein [Inmirania thermothiophila]ROR32408.1 acetyl-CoA synthetase [Inmirania thermothiophila]